MSDFAQRLASARKQCGLTQSEVAENLGVSFQAVSLWEAGMSSYAYSRSCCSLQT